ncbi:MAG TPA: aminoacyl-tRNA hydrolase [Acidimicrobiales bacterium]|nr:aminoacyl-tRNA hydrolase [Acidimicrobiales bacterium]
MATEPDLQISPGLYVPGRCLQWRFGPSGGPGGQHANRAHTRAELTLDLAGCDGLDDSIRARLVEKLGPTVTVTADEERSQLRNRGRARERLAARLAAALVRQRPRRPTRPTRGSQRRRVEAKKRRSQIKKGRGRPGLED